MTYIKINNKVVKSPKFYLPGIPTKRLCRNSSSRQVEQSGTQAGIQYKLDFIRFSCMKLHPSSSYRRRPVSSIKLILFFFSGPRPAPG